MAFFESKLTLIASSSLSSTDLSRLAGFLGRMNDEATSLAVSTSYFTNLWASVPTNVSIEGARLI